MTAWVDSLFPGNGPEARISVTMTSVGAKAGRKGFFGHRERWGDRPPRLDGPLFPSLILGEVGEVLRLELEGEVVFLLGIFLWSFFL